jgi:hypothetical protein
MIYLIRYQFSQIFKSRFLLLFILISTGFQYIGLKSLDSVTIQYQEFVSRLGEKQSIYLAIYFQLFIGFFISSIYGIWIMPYSHRDQRMLLTYFLPIEKWKVTLSYGVSFLFLMFLQHLILFISYASVFGFSSFLTATFPWSVLLKSLTYESISFLAMIYLFGAFSLRWGQMMTVMASSIFFFILQVASILLRFDKVEGFLDEIPKAGFSNLIYWAFPPYGEMMFDMRKIFAGTQSVFVPCALWLLWLIIGGFLFLVAISKPRLGRSSSN